MKKALALTLALVFAITALAGCSTPKTEAPPPAPSSVSEQPQSQPPESAPDGELSQPAGFPSKNIAWIVPAAAGAAIDLPTRVAADLLNLGKPAVVENIAGASQTLGTAEFAARPGDGHTMITLANAGGIAQPLMNDVAYDLGDFRYIAMLTATVQATICVKADSELQTPEQWIEHVKKGEFTYGIPNAGGYGHIVISKVLADLGCYDNGVQMVYNGSNDNIAAILNGEVEFAIVDSTDAIKNSNIRILAILDEVECPIAPGVPPMGDYGLTNLSTFVGLKYVAIRKDTPAEIGDWLKQEVNKVIQSKEYQDYLVQMGFGTVREYSEEELHELLEQAAVDYSEVMKAVGLIQ